MSEAMVVMLNDYSHQQSGLLCFDPQPELEVLPCIWEGEVGLESVISGCDEFRMYVMKVRMCTRQRSHDWTECPFAHPGEKARRRDPRLFRYSAAMCPDFRKGTCLRRDTCPLAHGVFECWLHPLRYRTQPCRDGPSCSRPVCFFAHSLHQLRLTSSPKTSPSVPSLLRDDVHDHYHALLSRFANLNLKQRLPRPHPCPQPQPQPQVRIRKPSLTKKKENQLSEDFPHLSWVADILN